MNNDKLSQMFENELEHHPEARLLDLYKLFMQSCLGPGHIIKDCDSVKHYLSQEVESCQQYISRFKSSSTHAYLSNLKNEYKKVINERIVVCTPLTPFTGGGDTIYVCPCLVLECDAFLPVARYSLQLIVDDVIPFDDYYQAFIKSYKETEYMAEEALVDIWCTRALPILKGYDIEGFDVDLRYIDELFHNQQYLVSHSETYREKYKPSYRLIDKKHMQRYERKILERYFSLVE